MKDFINKNRNIILGVISFIILIIVLKTILKNSKKSNNYIYTSYQEPDKKEEKEMFNPVEQLLQCDLGQQDPKVDCQSQTIVGYRRWICQQYPEDCKKLGVICKI